jgi:hypothetical protein
VVWFAIFKSEDGPLAVHYFLIFRLILYRIISKNPTPKASELFAKNFLKDCICTAPLEKQQAATCYFLSVFCSTPTNVSNNRKKGIKLISK